MDYVTILGLVAAVGSGLLFALSTQQPSTPPARTIGGKKTRRKRK